MSRIPAPGRPRAVWLACLALATVTAGCGDGRPESRAPEDDHSRMSAGATGRVVLVDDTGLGDRPDQGGFVVVIPVASKPWQRLGLPKPEPANPAMLAHSGVAVDPDTVGKLGGEFAQVGDDGSFSTSARGDLLLCRLPGTTTTGTAIGCVVTSLPVEGDLVLTFGEGGLGVRER